MGEDRRHKFAVYESQIKSRVVDYESESRISSVDQLDQMQLDDNTLGGK